MKVNYLNAIGFACLLSLSACASISMTRDLALKTLSEKSATDYFLYVDSAATVKRAIKDFGTTVPFKAKLVMIGEPKNFVDLVDFANTKGLTIKVLSPN